MNETSCGGLTKDWHSNLGNVTTSAMPLQPRERTFVARTENNGKRPKPTHGEDPISKWFSLTVYSSTEGGAYGGGGIVL